MAENHPPFSMQIGGIGAFPNLTRPRVIWAGVKTGMAEITAIAQEINTKLIRCGCPLARKPFHPHLTLSRLKSQIDLTPNVSMFQQFDAIDSTPIPVNAIRLTQSQLHPSGAVYTPLQTYPLNNCLTVQPLGTLTC